MARHHVIVSPSRDFIIVAVSGVRDDAAAREALGEVFQIRCSSGLERIFFDARDSRVDLRPEALMARALECGRRLLPSKVAILTDDVENGYARIWRKGLEETGHEAMVFTDVAAGEAWLLTAADAPMIYLP